MPVKPLEDDLIIRLLAQEAGLTEELPIFIMVSVGKPDGTIVSLSYPQDKVIGPGALYDLMRDNLANMQQCGKALEAYLSRLNHFAEHLKRDIHEHVQGGARESSIGQSTSDPAGSGGAAGKEETGQESQRLAETG